MRKSKFKLFIVAMALIMAIGPVTAYADLDFSFFDDPEAGSSTSGSSASAGTTPTSTAYPFSTMKSKIQQHANTNKEVVGWLTVPNTNMDFPITMSTKDNDYYLYRDWKGTNYSGISYLNYVDTATYLDFRTKLGTGWRSGTSKNLVLYGHNWNNLRDPFVIGNQSGYTMFAQLPSYTNLDFAKNNSHVYFSTENMEGIWRVFAVGYSETSTDFFYNNPNPGTEAYQEILDGWRARSLLNFDVDVTTDDRIVTLSTCTRNFGNFSEGGAGNLQRFVVVARLLRDGESENDTVNVTVNPNPKRPDFSNAK